MESDKKDEKSGPSRGMTQADDMMSSPGVKGDGLAEPSQKPVNVKAEAYDHMKHSGKKAHDGHKPGETKPSHELKGATPPSKGYGED